MLHIILGEVNGNVMRDVSFRADTFWLNQLRERDFNNTELREKKKQNKTKLTKTVRPVKFNEHFARSMVFEGPFAPAYYVHGTLTHTTSSNDYIETNWRTPSYVLKFYRLYFVLILSTLEANLCMLTPKLFIYDSEKEINFGRITQGLKFWKKCMKLSPKRSSQL